jgi:cyclopropane-fatty-acyl-phospholipid synthase
VVRICIAPRHQCTGISISQTSIDYLNGRSEELGYDWELIHADLLAYQTDRKYDAIVIMESSSTCLDDRVLARFASLVKPGGYVFLDGSACTKSTNSRPSW